MKICLIHTGPSARVRATLLNTKGMIADIYRSNSDGLGVMYKNKRGLRIVKIVPKTLDEVTRLIDQLPQDDREIAMHWRMKTHGDIDLTNCHPYVVVPGRVAMMHNGILHTGNHADKSKSDTWHFIQDYLAGPMALSKDLAHSPEFIELLANYIEDNRFVFMDDEGRMSIVNKDQGVEHDGMWFSNTYAWSPEMLIPGYRSVYGGRGAWGDNDWEDYYTARNSKYDRYTTATQAVCMAGTGGNVVALTHHTGSTPEDRHETRHGAWTHEMEEDFIAAVFEGTASVVASALQTFPFSAISALEKQCTPTMTESMCNGGMRTLSDREQKILEAVFHGDLSFKAHSLPLTTADVICYYVNWEVKEAADEPEVPGEAEDDSLAEDDRANDGREFSYGGFRIRLFYDDHASVWGYGSFGENLVEIDSGYGYETAQEAMKWATDAIDALCDAREEEQVAWAH